MSGGAGGDRTRVLVLFGGRSGEHSVSCLSARGVLWAIEESRYDVVPVGIRRDGRWRLMPTGVTPTRQGTLPTVPDSGEPVVLAPTPDGARLLGMSVDGLVVDHGRVDVCFPVLHGPYGEDGTIQGLLASVGVPYVGCGVAASALAMDKRQTKHVLEREGLPVLPFSTVRARDWAEDRRAVLDALEHDTAYPLFTKPTSQGSSIGVSLCRNRSELETGIDTALEYNRNAIVEHALLGVRELEVGVLGSEELRVSQPGEAFHTGVDFYDFDAKYLAPVTLRCPADIPGGVSDRCRDVAARAYRAIGCSSMARVDLFYVPQTDTVLVNEINPMPLLTADSMFPMVWEAEGLGFRALVDELLTSYEPLDPVPPLP